MRLLQRLKFSIKRRWGMTLVEVILALSLMGLLSGAIGMAMYNTSLAGIRSNYNSMIDNEMRIFVELVQRYALTSDFALAYKSPAVEDRDDPSDRLTARTWGDYIVFARMGIPDTNQANSAIMRMRPITKLHCIARPDSGPTVYMYTIEVPEDQQFQSIEELLPASTLGQDPIVIATIKATDTNPDGLFYIVNNNQFHFILPLVKTYRGQTQSAFCQTSITCPNFL